MIWSYQPVWCVYYQVYFPTSARSDSEFSVVKGVSVVVVVVVVVDCSQVFVLVAVTREASYDDSLS